MKKVLYVGLGGFGCETVCRIKKRIGDSNQNIHYICFDTDMYMEEWLDGIPFIHLKFEKNTEEFLNSKSYVDKHIPISHVRIAPYYYMTRGLAGLEFCDLIGSSNIDAIHNPLLSIFNGIEEHIELQIIIISSLAGNTGSGIFLQTALYLKDYFNARTQCNIQIDGIFAFPDLYKSVCLSKIQMESMYANTYASLRELNAINCACLSDVACRIQFDGLFDANKDRLNVNKKPYDSIFFVDDLNTVGRMLSDIDEYKQMVATVAIMHSHVFGQLHYFFQYPIKQIYGSIGASRIVYPYQELVDYCGIRATIDELDDIWLYIDRLYCQACHQNHNAILNDLTVKEINRYDFYINTVADILKEKTSKFDFIRDDTSLINADGLISDKVDVCYEELYEYIANHIKNDEQLNVISNKAVVTEEQLKNDLAGNVFRCESQMKEFFEAIQNRIILIRSSTVKSIFPDNLSLGTYYCCDSVVVKLFTNNGHIVHPLSVRLLLYKFRTKIFEEYNKYSTSVSNLFDLINDYFKSAYDIKETEIAESAEDRATCRNIFGRIRFRREYFEKSSVQKMRLEKYRELKMIVVIFGDILKRLDALIQQYDLLFDSLESIRTDLQNEVFSFEEKAHTNLNEETIYLFSSAEEKKNLYSSLHYKCSEQNETGEFDCVFCSLYSFAHEAFVRSGSRLITSLFENNMISERKEQMNKVFRNNIVKRNIADLKEKYAWQLDLDVYDALKKAANGNQEYIKETIRHAFIKSRPFLNYSASEGLRYNTLWGMTPSIEEKISQHIGFGNVHHFFDSAINYDGVSTMSIKDEFSKYEICCCQKLIGIDLADITKLSDDDNLPGIIYQSYLNRINKMIKKEKSALSPHLDSRWHCCDYLPRIAKLQE